jgi:hypothetical protein
MKKEKNRRGIRRQQTHPPFIILRLKKKYLHAAEQSCGGFWAFHAVEFEGSLHVPIAHLGPQKFDSMNKHEGI